MDILKFITAGNVDDGKSTLIGRLLFDTGNIKDDVLLSVGNSNNDALNLAHITDGLRAERVQGITIDVAYKYFTTLQRKYIITDAPGHFQYTKNLVTGASSVDLIIILIDAVNGITEQTRRHSLVASFLKIRNVIVAINKMDAIEYSETVFTEITNEYRAMAGKLYMPDITYIPISALVGDNVTFPSEQMRWHSGKTLVECLEECQPALSNNDVTRFSIQYVIDSGEEGLETGYAGKVLSGKLNVGDSVYIYPSLRLAKIMKIIRGQNARQDAHAGDSICLYLEKNIEAARGDLLCEVNSHLLPRCQVTIEATVCWLDADNPLLVNENYFLKINAFETLCKITDVMYKIDVDSFEQYTDKTPVDVNKFARVIIETKDKVSYDVYSSLRETGRGILIDMITNYTSAVFTIEGEK